MLEFAKPDLWAKPTGIVAGYPQYDGWVLITKDKRLPWIPKTLADLTAGRYTADLPLDACPLEEGRHCIQPLLGRHRRIDLGHGSRHVHHHCVGRARTSLVEGRAQSGIPVARVDVGH